MSSTRRLHTHLTTAHMAHTAPCSTYVHPAVRHFTRVEDAIHYIIVAYMLFVCYGPRMLQRCAVVRVDVALRVWHACLAVAYAAGAVVAARALRARVQQVGMYATMCHVALMHGDDVYVMCVSIVVVLKMLSLLDTLFVCLRKAPIGAMHFGYHSASVLYFWHCANTPQPWALPLFVAVLTSEAATRALRCCRGSRTASAAPCDGVRDTAPVTTQRDAVCAALMQCCRLGEAVAGLGVCAYVMRHTTPPLPGSVGFSRGGCTSPVPHVHLAMFFCSAYLAALLYRCAPSHAADATRDKKQQ